MNYQDILGNCSETTVGQLASRCPRTLDVFRKYMPEIESHRHTTAIPPSTWSPPSPASSRSSCARNCLIR